MKTILLDLDGVLNEYKGDYIPGFIPPLRKDAKEFLQLLSKDFKVIIFSTREETLVKKWLEQNCLTPYVYDVTNKKEPAFVQIDDRCINFNGDYSSTIENIKKFKPFWQKA